MDARTVIDMWPSKRVLAAELGLKLTRVRQWYTRNSIPATCWGPLVRAAKRRGYVLAVEDLLDAHAA